MLESKNFRFIKSRPRRNHGEQYFEKILRKTIKFYKKFEEESQKFRWNSVKFPFTQLEMNFEYE